MAYDYKQFHQRKLPHLHSPGSTLFITYRLRNSVPQTEIERWKKERRLLEDECHRLKEKPDLAQHTRREFHRRWFGQFERMLHEDKGSAMVEGSINCPDCCRLTPSPGRKII
jgi:hypothetical protein